MRSFALPKLDARLFFRRMAKAHSDYNREGVMSVATYLDRFAFVADAGPRGLDDGAVVLPRLQRLERGWEALAARSPLPTQHFAWSRACVETFARGGTFRAISIGPEDAPAALAPLVRSADWRLETPGRQLHEPADFIYADTHALRLLAQKLAAARAALYLPRLPADSPTLSALKKAYARRALARSAQVTPSPYIVLDDSWKEPERHFNSGRRSDLRRARRHAERLGEVSFEVIAPSPMEIDALLAEAFRVEAAGWKSERGTALALDPLRGRFFERYAAIAARKGSLRLCFMRIGRIAVAMQLAVECAGAFSLLKIGYDERFARCAPGMLLMLHTVQYAAEAGLQTYEFLGAPAAWTKVWTERERPYVSLRIYPFSTLGAAALGADAARRTLSRVRFNFLRRR